MLPASPSGAPAGRTSLWPRTFRALRHRNFRLYWFGQGVSLAGTWMQIVAQGWLVYRLTDSPLMLGLVNVVALLPVVPLSLVAGAISDRLPRRKLIALAETVLMLQAFALAALVWFDWIQVWHVIVLGFVFGAASAVEQPARLAFVVDTVGEEDLTNAVALNSSVYNVGRIVGPSVAGLLVASVGEAGCFFVNGVTYLAVILALLAMRLPAHVAPAARLRVANSVVDGFKYVWHNSTLRALMAIVAISSFFIMPYMALMPAFARDVLDAGPQGLGFLMAAVGLGAISAALGVAGLQAGRRGRWITFGNLLAPLFLILFCLSHSFAASMVLAFALGASNAVRHTLATGMVQLISSQQYHGRVMSLFSLLFNGMSQMGALGLGSVAEVTGVPWALGGGAIVSAVGALVVMRYVPGVHRLP
jgi:MFS family permease